MTALVYGTSLRNKLGVRIPHRVQNFYIKMNMIALREFVKNKQNNNISELNDWYYRFINENFESIDDWLFSENKLQYDNFLIDVPSYSFYQDKLYERLAESLTTSNKFFLKLLKSIDGIIDYEIINSFSIKISINDNFDINSESFKSFLNFSNYQIANQLSNSIYLTGVKPKELEYKNEFAYHVTFLKNWNKIQNQGLIPKYKSNMEYYDSRIYLWIGDIKNDNFKYKIHSFGRLIKRINKSDDEIIILKINLKQFEQDNNEKIKLFGDPSHNSESATFTLEPIKSKYIERIN